MPMNQRLLRPRASGWTPSSLGSKLAAWYDASAASTVALSGSAVSQWSDRSPNGRHIAQATPDNRPTYAAGQLNGKPAITFDGSNDRLTNTSAGSAGITDCSFFAVTRFVTGGNNEDLLLGLGEGNQPNRLRSLYRAANGTTLGFAAWGNDLTSSAYSVDIAGSYNIFGLRQSGTSVQIRRNGLGTSYTLGSAMQTVQTDNLFLGAPHTNPATNGVNYASNVSFAEIVVLYESASDANTSLIEGYLAWKWGLQAQLPYNHPYAKSFSGYGSQATPTDSDALTYLSAVATADGAPVEVGVANAINDFIVGCKADGIWSSIKASCILMGARTLSGALTPLVGSAPTNNSFLAADYNRETGLIGNGTTKSLNSNRNNNADPQDSFHAAVYASTAGTSSGTAYFGAGSATNETGATNFGRSGGGGTGMFFRCRSSNAFEVSGVPTGFIGTARSSSAEYTYRVSGTTGTRSETSQSPANANLFVYSATNTAFPTNARFAFYSIGEALTLATLDSRVSALYNAIGAAIP